MASTDELSLLERVFLRVGSAETDEQLQNAIAKFLLPVLLKLSSPQEGVRKKVMELLVHINKRVKCRSTIQLPVESLLLQYQDPSATSFVINFTIIYIKLGYPRMVLDKQVELLPNLLNCIEGKPQSHQDSLLLMLIPVLAHVKPPANIEKRKNFLGLHEKPKLVKYLCDFMLDVILLPYGVFPSEVQVPQGNSSQSLSLATANSSVVLTPAPPGLNEYSFRRVTGENPLSPDDLAKAKLGIVKFLGSQFLNDDDVIVLLMVAVSDTRHGVVDAAEMELKRIISAVDLNNSVTISKIYSLFLGTLKDKDPKVAVKAELRRTPANGRIRMKLFPYLLKSREAVAQFPACIQVVFDCLFCENNTNLKLKHMAVQFVQHICLNCCVEWLSPIAPVFLSGMQRLIVESEDWIVLKVSSVCTTGVEEFFVAKFVAKLRGLAYVAIAKLGLKLPQLVNKDMALVQSFFEAASEEVQETRAAVQEALSIMSGAFRNLDPANMKIMEGLLASYIDKPEPRVRMLAIQYAAQVFDSDHIPSRYLLLLSAGDTKEEVYAEAAKVLKTVPTKSKMQAPTDIESCKLPPFVEMMTYISDKAQQRLASNQKYVVGTQALAFNPATCTEVITIMAYLRMCLRQNAGLSPVPKDGFDDSPLISKYVRSILAENQSCNARAVLLYIDFIKQLLIVTLGTSSMYSLLEIVAFAPDVLAPQFVSQLDWIKGLMFSTKEDMRHYASQLYAIIVANSFNDASFATGMEQLMKYADDGVVEQRHAAIFGLGYSLSRKALLLNRSCSLKEAVPVSVQAVNVIVGFLKDPQPSFVQSACTVLGELGRFGSLPLPDSSDTKDGVSKLSVINALLELVSSSKSLAKVREKAATAVGYVCVGEHNFPHRKIAMEGLLASASGTKDVDLHFTIGEALAWAALGSAAPVGRDFWSVSVDDFAKSESAVGVSEEEDYLPWLLLKICDEYVTNQNPLTRQAASIWLISLLKNCSSHSALKSYLEKLQNVFTKLLSETNETTQDMASKGLGLIYESCDESQKNMLVSALVDTLMNGQRPAHQVTGDTQIFEEGALGSVPHGGSLSTYKELCSLASDLNQPDLVYRFMHLANHNSVWNSKKGAAFGFSTIAMKAGEQLQPFLPQIIPRLYRYQYDPNLKIQLSMRSIWDALVTDPQKMVDKYLKEILADLKSNLTSGLWRNRESSCLALADLLKGRQAFDVIDDLAELWDICFRVQDDIKESVRLAAESALKSLSKVSIRLCDSNAGKSGHRAIASILPVLLKSGLLSPVLEVRTISLATITEIGKNAGSLLKPHIPLLTAALLESLSSLESQEINYLSVRLGNQQNTQEKLDNARIAVAKSSPMMDTITKCLPFVDDQVLVELVPRLVDLMRSSVGLGTKAGCAHYISSLTHHCLNDLKPHAGKLLSALLHGLNDRSAAVRKIYATCIGHVVKAAKDSSVEKLIDRLKTAYFEKEEAAAHMNCAHVLNAIAKQSPDVLKVHFTRALPLAFLAMHSLKKKDSSDDDCDNSVWEEIWTEATPGSEAGIRLYLVEIVELVQMTLGSQSWRLKAQGASAAHTVATKMKASLGSPHLEDLLKAVLAGLSGRTWDDKHFLLRDVAALYSNCRTALEDVSVRDPSVSVEKVLDVMLKECQRELVSYKLEAITCTAEILHSCDYDRFEEMYKLISAVLENNDSYKSEDRNEQRFEMECDRNSINAVGLHEVCFDALGKSWPTNKCTQDKLQRECSTFLCSYLENRPQKIQTVVMEALARFLKRLCCLQCVSDDDDAHAVHILAVILPTIFACAAVGKSDALRSKILSIFEVILTSLKESNKMRLLTKDQLVSMLTIAERITQESQADLREQGSTVLKYLR